ncbi:MAG: hypothetical protein J6L70_00975 [Alphaproteobacteria bacterium]|nr:hypothetical protein [Alphaproteobacteria bacterium]
MALKPRYKRRIIWSLVSIFAALVLSIIILPSIITLNRFKPMIEAAVFEQTNVPAKLNGSIHFSLLSGATIVAHDVVVPTASIGAVMFSVPFKTFFNPKNPEIEPVVTIYDADITIDKLAPAVFNHDINIYDSNIMFMGRPFHIISAEMINNKFHGIVRSPNHKYDVEFSGDTFHITNKNNNLDITGQFFDNGTIRGHMSFTTNDINGWLDIPEPKITDTVNISMNFEWNGGTGFKYTNIQTDKITGNIEILPNGNRIIELKSNDLDYDFSFLLHPGKMLHETKYDMDFYGKLKFLNHEFKHLRINASATNDALNITNIVADDIAATGGTIDSTGAHNVLITMPFDGRPSTCMFSGTPDNWKCAPYSYGDIIGNISVNNNTFDMTIRSDNKMPKTGILNNRIKKLGNHGKIDFQFSDVAGTYNITPDNITPHFTFAHDKTLRWMNINLPFLPDFMNNDIGDFVWRGNILDFTPHNKMWQIQIDGKKFKLSGKSTHTWLPGLDLRAINDMPYIISGTYDNGVISDLVIELSNHKFTGSIVGNNITLHTPLLNLNTFISKSFIDNYSELEFLTNTPIMIPFNINANISLSADLVEYNGDKFKNFVYSLKDNAQIFSITDNDRGNILATIEKDKNNYDIFLQMNKFVINGNLLNNIMPLNIRDTMITSEIHLKTSGQIAHDIWYNMAGEMDLSFDGGYIVGLSFDEFYASARDITKLNAEFALARALGGGETSLKQMRIIGKYQNGNFITTEPLKISMRHIEGFGNLEIENGEMYTQLDLTLRGTSPVPSVIQVDIMPDGTRRYSLSEIMINFDPDYMREFIKTHNRF